MTTDQMRLETLVVFVVVCALLLSPMASTLPLHDSEIEASPSASELTARSSLNLPDWLAVARCRSVCVNEFARVRSDAGCEADSNCSVCWSLCFRLTAQFALYRALCASVRRACKPGVVRACETACEHRLNQSAIAAVPQRVRTDVIVHASTANWNRSSRQFSLRFEGLICFRIDVDLREHVRAELARDNRSVAASAVAALLAMRVPLYWLLVRPRVQSGQQWSSFRMALDGRFAIDWPRVGAGAGLEEPERLAFVVLVVWPLGILGTSADVLLELPVTTPSAAASALGDDRSATNQNQSLFQAQQKAAAADRSSDPSDARLALVLVGIVALVALTALAVLALGLAVLVRALRSKQPPRLVRMVRDASLRGRRSIEGFVRGSLKRGRGAAGADDALPDSESATGTGSATGSGTTTGVRQQKEQKQQEDVELVLVPPHPTATIATATAEPSNEASLKAPLRAVKSAAV